MASWEEQIEDVQELWARQFLEFHKTVALTYFRAVSQPVNQQESGSAQGVVSNTEGFAPIWSGRFRASNRISIGSPETDTAPPVIGYQWPERVPKQVRPEAKSAAEARRELQALTTFSSIWVSNNLPYAARIEEDGHSQQAPKGVYGVAAESVAQQFNNTRPLDEVVD